MCGIAGIISKRAPLEENRIEEMITTIRHRGPDGEGFFKTPFAHIGMSRLAIIDLKSANLCPIVYKKENGSLVALAYNGEIYNYVELKKELQDLGHEFDTTSDAEVLLHSYLQWGDQCLERLNGMFAFAILDLDKDLLFAARDRVGEKPFYYYNDDKQFIFASEIKSILTQIPLPELNITDEFRAFEYMSGKETLFKNIHSLLPAHKLSYRGVKGKYLGKKVSEYWNVIDRISDPGAKNPVDKLDELLQDSVRLRLRGDVPLGLYLSGGIDSALIGYMAKPDICFSCNFPYGSKYDELEYAKVVAKEIKARHIIIQPEREDFEKYLPDVMYHLDMPVGSFSMFPLFMLAREACKHVKIVLSGEGADELFSGYTRYLIMVHEEELFRHPSMKNYAPLLDYYYGNRLDRFAKLLNRGNVSDDVVKSVISEHFAKFDDIVHQMGYTEFKLMLVTLLHMEDRTAAAFGVENRSPLLDHRLIEFAYSIPGDFKIREMTPKWILREVAKRYLPGSIMERTDKMGLIAPINVWLRYKGIRGEYDRGAYNKLCMEKWLQVFFDEARFKGHNMRRKIKKPAHENA